MKPCRRKLSVLFIAVTVLALGATIRRVVSRGCGFTLGCVFVLCLLCHVAMADTPPESTPFDDPVARPKPAVVPKPQRRPRPVGASRKGPSRRPQAPEQDGLELSPRTDIRELKQRMRPRRIALLIGISKYKDRAWNDLRYPARDVSKMKALMLRLGRFDEVMTLTKASQTSLSSVREGLRWLKTRTRSSQDVVVIYISGHGSIAPPRSGRVPERYLVTSDSTRDLPGSGLAIREIKAVMAGLPARRKALVLATCYVGNQAQVPGQLKAVTSGIKGTYTLGGVSRTTLVLSAAGYMQPAYEMDQVRGDVYTHFFVDCAKQRYRQQQASTATAIHRCATKRTYQYVKRHLKREQVPSIESRILGKDTLFLVGESLSSKRPSQGRFLATPKQRLALVQVRKGRLRWLSVQPKGSKGGAAMRRFVPHSQGFLTLRLLPGWYRLVLQNAAGRTITREVEVLPGLHELSPQGELSASLGDDDDDGNDDGAHSHHSNHSNAPGTSDNPYANIYAVAGSHFLPSAEHVLLGAWLGGGGQLFHFGLLLHGGFGQNLETRQAMEEPLFRFGLTMQVGYTFRFGNIDLYPNLYGEIGLWTVRDSSADMSFLVSYGPQLRIRWWMRPKSALQIGVGAFYTYSPDQPGTERNIFGNPKYLWTQRLHFSIFVGGSFSLFSG